VGSCYLLKILNSWQKFVELVAGTVPEIDVGLTAHFLGDD
jgi:hypothetical protein